MKTRRSKFHAPRSPAKRLADTAGNNVCDAYPHDVIARPKAQTHRKEDRFPKKD